MLCSLHLSAFMSVQSPQEDVLYVSMITALSQKEMVLVRIVSSYDWWR